MSEYFVPNVEEFIEGARREFDFLVNEYGFRECKVPFKYRNPYSIFFKKKNIFVYIEGLSYGFSLGVQIGKIGLFKKIKERFSLGYVISLRSPELFKPRYPEKRGQIEQMKESSIALKQCAEDFLKGDFSDLHRLKKHIDEENKKSQEEYETKEIRDIGIKASKAFHSGNYKDAINLLEPLQAKLSKAQLLVLSQSKKKLASTSVNTYD